MRNNNYNIILYITLFILILSGCGSSSIEEPSLIKQRSVDLGENSIKDLIANPIDNPTTETPTLVIGDNPPSITLTGANPLMIKLGSSYSEPGFSVHDDEDGDITDYITVDASNLDTMQLGSYEILYHVQDSHGNEASIRRTVQVISELLLPSHRRVDWNPGITTPAPVSSTRINVKDYGALGNGSHNDASAIQQAIGALPDEGGIVYIPEGTYLMNSPLTISKNNISIIGDGRDKTRLKFNYTERALGAILISSKSHTGWQGIAGGYTKGSTEITVQDGSLYSGYKYLEIQQKNDPEKMYTRAKWNASWGHDAVGEIIKIKSIHGNIISLEEPLSHNYRSRLSPELRGVHLIEYGGIESLYIELTRNTNAHTIWIDKAAYTKIKNIESNMTSRGHVNIWSSYKCEVTDSYFHHSYDYGEGGHGYGVQLMRHTTGCLTQNNIFHDLRHSMILSIGPSANVFAYNYSHSNRSQTAAKLADIALHGFYPSYNLFEGNVVQEIGIADYWGPAGPGNTFLRNCVGAENIDVLDSSHNQNIIGNILTGRNNKLIIHSGVMDTLAHGNQSSDGIISWDEKIADRTIPASYYLQKKPKFFGSSTWPASDCNIPAR